MPDFTRITAAEAHEAVRSQAFHVDDPESSDYGRSLVHCFRTFTGADWDEDAVHDLIDQADVIAWRAHLLSSGPCLFVTDTEGTAYYFDTIRPPAQVRP